MTVCVISDAIQSFRGNRYTDRLKIEDIQNVYSLICQMLYTRLIFLHTWKTDFSLYFL